MEEQSNPVGDPAAELRLVRRNARSISKRATVAVAMVESALAVHGHTRHPLVDVLLDIRNVLRNG